MHSLICPLCMYWAPACIGCLAVKVLLFIHPFTMHGLNACCLLGTGLCPRLQQGIGQSVSDFMELPFAFLLFHHYTGPSQQPLGRGYFHFLFTNEHSEGGSRWVICSGWAESKLEPGFPVPNAVPWMSHAPPPGPLMGPCYLWQRTHMHHAGVMQQGQVGLGEWKRTCCSVSLYSSGQKLPSQNVDPRQLDSPIKITIIPHPTLFIFMQNMSFLKWSQFVPKSSKALDKENTSVDHIWPMAHQFATCSLERLPAPAPRNWKSCYHLGARPATPKRRMPLSSSWALLSQLQGCLTLKPPDVLPSCSSARKTVTRQGDLGIFKILKWTAYCLPVTSFPSFEVTWTYSHWTRYR